MIDLSKLFFKKIFISKVNDQPNAMSMKICSEIISRAKDGRLNENSFEVEVRSVIYKITVTYAKNGKIIFTDLFRSTNKRDLKIGLQSAIELEGKEKDMKSLHTLQQLVDNSGLTDDEKKLVLGDILESIR